MWNEKVRRENWSPLRTHLDTSLMNEFYFTYEESEVQKTKRNLPKMITPNYKKWWWKGHWLQN